MAVSLVLTIVLSSFLDITNVAAATDLKMADRAYLNYEKLMDSYRKSSGCTDRKFNCFEIISSLGNEDCNKAIRRILSRIDVEMIVEITAEIPVISDLQMKMRMARKERILEYSINQLHKREKDIVFFRKV